MTDENYSAAESTWIGNSDTIGELARILLPTHWKFERVQITGGWPIALESQHNIMMKGGTETTRSSNFGGRHLPHVSKLDIYLMSSWLNRELSTLYIITQWRKNLALNLWMRLELTGASSKLQISIISCHHPLYKLTRRKLRLSEAFLNFAISAQQQGQLPVYLN
jgi:hypothetical protein